MGQLVWNANRMQSTPPNPDLAVFFDIEIRGRSVRCEPIGRHLLLSPFPRFGPGLAPQKSRGLRRKRFFTDLNPLALSHASDPVTSLA